MNNERAKQIQGSIDNALASLETGKINVMDADAEFNRISAVIDNDIQTLTKAIIRVKYPKSSSINANDVLIGEAQKQRAYNLLNADMSIIKNEMTKSINEKNFDFAFTLGECVFANDNLNASTKHSIDKIFNDAVTQTNVLDLANRKKKLQYIKKETDYILSNLGKSDPGKLKHDAQFERSKWDIVFTKHLSEQPTKPFFELYADIK